ncbi:MAG TPA: alpha/beta hydrolase [Chloroflexota bacterium]
MPLVPQARALLDQLEQQGLPPFEQMTVPQAREVIAGFKDLQAEPPPIASTDDRVVDGPLGPIPVRVYTPTDAEPRPLLVYFHGGGWITGNIDIGDKPCRALAAATGGVVVSVEYRMGPEDRFPAAVDDCFAATRWAAEHAAELGAEPGRLVVIGDSAGGNLAAVVALEARDRGGPEIAYQVLIYPVTDYRFDYPSYLENGEGYLLTTEGMRWFWGNYLASAEQGRDPRAAPMRAADLSGLPPALVITGEFDPLRDEGEAYAERLSAAGVPVKRHRFDGMIHGFFWMSLVMPQAQELLDEIANELAATRRPVAVR